MNLNIVFCRKRIDTPNFKLALDYIRDNLFEFAKLGKTILNDEVYFNVEEYETKEEKDTYFESHKKYCDIQIVVSGVENIGFQDIDSFSGEITNPYDDAKDVIKYKLSEYTKIKLLPGDAAIFFPEDLHAPKMKSLEFSNVRKVVFKVKL
ncbi:MAG: YhcH/YjgK/YiaL family protein [Acholeplasmatales bacterium]|jgi:YhcH/YjgK/YiaL family protein|nr:YhcH/YjgK/YiaL family protein [Acholeplasmatales bacterium]